MTDSDLAREWRLLQAQTGHYEKYSLLIKLLAVVLTALALRTAPSSAWTLPIIAVLWLQDGIWKTFQSRLDSRILQLEVAINGGDETATAACQLHTEFQRQRPKAMGLIASYLSEAGRPTVAYPYIALLALLGFRVMG